MKKSVLILVFFGLLLSVKAQQTWCGTNYMMEKYFNENPEIAKKYAAYRQALSQLKPQQQVNNKGQILYIIPLAVHVIHYNGAGNISKAQILDGIRVLNEDFNKRNPDTSLVRSVFRPYIADFQIEFRLAKKDPQGNPTEGINRINHHYTYDRGNEPKTLIRWDVYSYLNIWIVNTIDLGNGANTLGFAQMPFTGPSGFGLVVRAAEWGTIEYAQGKDGRTSTHEIGHCLTLEHTFDGGCGSTCHNTGDWVCDTPPQFDDLNNSCSPTFNTCSNDTQGGTGANPNPFNSNVPDQIENYMGYGIACQGMFSEGQKRQVFEAITVGNRNTSNGSFYFAFLDSLTTPYNNIQTGTNTGYVGPTPELIAQVLTFDRFTCQGGTIAFSEDSYGGPINSYSWSFPGGSPSSSTNATPSITYNTPGNYDVTLRVTNAAGTDSLVLQNYVHVSTSSATFSGVNYVESFENTAGFNNQWVLIDKSASTNSVWDHCTFAGYTGTKSLWINNRNCSYSGAVDQAVSPSIRMSDVLNPSISMRVAYRRKNNASADKLKLKASLDCGNSWVTILDMNPVFYAFDNGLSTGNFIATSAAQWKLVTIPSGFIPSNIKTGNLVKFMIEMEHGNGNNLFVDDFQINGQPVGIGEEVVAEDDFMVFPNPASELVNLKFNFLEAYPNSKLYVRDVVGKKYPSIFEGKFEKGPYQFVVNTDDLASGVYFVVLELNGKMSTRKLIVN